MHQCIQSFMAQVSNLGDKKKDADILLPQWENGAGWDMYFGVCHNCPPSMPDCSLQASRAIMKTRGQRKQLKYADRARAVGARFPDVIISTWCSFGPTDRDA